MGGYLLVVVIMLGIESQTRTVNSNTAGSINDASVAEGEANVEPTFTNQVLIARSKLISYLLYFYILIKNIC